MQKKTVNIRLLIEGCLQQNRGSQRRLYEQYYGYGMSITLRYAQNREEAAEIMNDAFLKAFKNLDKFNPQQSFKSWFRRILINTCIDHFRAKKNMIFFVDLDHAEAVADTEIPMPKLSPDEDVLPILKELSPSYRMVFNLYVLEGYKHHEVAQMLDISVGTSKSNLARAKQILRKLLENKSNYKNRLHG